MTGGRCSDILPVMRRRWVVTGVVVLGVVGIVLPVTAIALLRITRPLFTPYMLVRALVADAPMDYRWMPRSRMAPTIGRAVIAGEDSRFMQHHGFDWTEMESAWRDSRHGRQLRGASTISMQCARALFLWPGRSLVRKVVEAYLTVLVEGFWPKGRILEMYLNVVEWGDGVYGCEAAAQFHLHTSCASLDAEQAARLVAILPSPRRWSASRPSHYLRRRIATILQRMPHVEVPRPQEASLTSSQILMSTRLR